MLLLGCINADIRDERDNNQREMTPAENPPENLFANEKVVENETTKGKT